MTKFTSAQADAAALSTPTRAWDDLTQLDAPTFYSKFGPLPAVTGVRDQTGDWRSVGQTRTLLLSDGGSVVETITNADSPVLFAYELTEFQKLFGMLVSSARAEWHFEPSPAGTSIRWTYEFHAKRGRGWFVGLIVKLFWAPYMRRVLPPIAASFEREPS